MPEDSRPGPIKNHAPGESVAAEMQAQEALQMKAEGMTYQQIAERLGCSKAWAWQLVHRGWERLIEDNDQIRAMLREVEIERLEELIAAAMPLAVGDVEHLADEVQQNAAENKLKAIGAVVKCIQTIARLRGLNAPLKIEHTGGKRTLEKLDALRERVTAARQRQVSIAAGSN